MSDLAARVEALAARSKRRNAEARVVDEAKAVSLAAEREARRLLMREKMPEVTAFVDGLKAVFGDDQVRVLMAEEGGERVVTKAWRDSRGG